jgi:superfamily II DNA helicase RecQ
MYNEKYGQGVTELKPLQRKALAAMMNKKDAICMLPTGYGKSLVYELCPILYEEIFGKSCCVFVFEPLNVIIEQQLSKLGPSAISLKVENDASVVNKLRSGDYTYIYTHPEHIIGKKAFNDLFISPVYGSKGVFIVVDEAHCVLDWGEEYRPTFRHIKDMRPILPHAQMLALSATLTLSGQKDVVKHLMMKNYTTVSSLPTKQNISLIVLRRPPLSSKISSKETCNFVLQPLLQELKCKDQNFPLTLIYLSGTMDWVGYAYEYSKQVLGEDMYAGEHQKQENRRVAMYHSSIGRDDEVSLQFTFLTRVVSRQHSSPGSVTPERIPSLRSRS